MKNIPTLKCKECGSLFKPYSSSPSRVKRTKYCSIKCRQQSTIRSARIIMVMVRRGTGKGYVKVGGRHEHRVVAERMIGRKLIKGEVVHHINGDKKDNRPENLVITTQSKHIESHRDVMQNESWRKWVKSKGFKGVPCWMNKNNKEL